MPDISIDTKSYLQTIGLFGTGVCVITTQGADGPHGMTANAVTSLSLDPMLIIFCVAKQAKMAAYLKKGHCFTVNILRDEQEVISNHFAGFRKDNEPPPFRFVDWDGGPRIEGVLAAVGCEVFDTPEGGDHLIVLGKVNCLHQGIGPHKPLLYFKSRYRNLAPDEGSAAPDRIDLGGEVSLFVDPWGG